MNTRVTLVALACSLSMLGAAAMGQALKPRQMMSDVQPVNLEAMVPLKFGNWSMVPGSDKIVLDASTQQSLDRLYSQVLNRVYVDPQGRSVMLAIAYGKEQRIGLLAHRPDVCYPAQGFSISNTTSTRLQTPFGEIPAERLYARKGARSEPITFWFTLGETALTSTLQRRLTTLRYGLTGQIADGMLFRVSSLDPDADHGYQVQGEFVADLSRALSPSARTRLAGLHS